VLENRHLRVTLLPERGGALFELLWKPGDVDLLWRWERGLRPVGYVPSLPLSQGNYQDHFFGGWDIMFPTVDRFQPVAPLPIGYHGEVACLPWRSRITADEPDEVAVELTVRCIRAPFLVTRILRLTHLPELVIETTIENLAKRPVSYAVGEHIALNIDPLLPGKLQLGGAVLTTADGEASPHARLAPGQRSEWPIALLSDGNQTDVSRIDADALGTSDVIGLVDLAEPTIRVVPTEGPLPPFSLTWDGELMPSLLLWLGLGGDLQAPWFGTATLLAVEPMSLLPWADPDQLPKADPREVIVSQLRVTVGDVIGDTE
jgi:hypothetical protein